jgi:hypothetical protein
VAHRGHSGSRRLDVWAYSDENPALRAAAKLALDCGLDEEHEAVKRYQQRDYRWIIDRHNEKTRSGRCCKSKSSTSSMSPASM